VHNLKSPTTKDNPAEVPSPGGDEWDVREIITFLKDKWRLILKVTVLFFIGVVLYTLIQSPQYASTTRLVVQEEKPEVAGLIQKGVPVVQRLFGYGNVGNQLEFLKSRVLIERLVEEEHLQVQVGSAYGFFGKLLRPLRKISAFFKPRGIAEDLSRQDRLYRLRVVDAQIEDLSYKEERRFILSVTGSDSFSITGPSLAEPVEGKIGQWVGLGKSRLKFDFSPAVKLGEKFAIKLINKERAIDQISSSRRVFRSSREANHIIVEFRYPNPVRAQQLLKKLVEIYQSVNRELKARDTRESLTFIRKELKEVQSRLRSAQQALDAFQESKGVYLISDEAKAIVEQLVELKKWRNNSDIYLKVLDRVLKGLEQGNDEAVSGLLEFPATEEIQLSDILTRFSQLLQSRQAQLLYKTEEHPDIIALNEQIEALRGQVKEVISADYERTRTRIAEIDDKISELEDKLLSFPRIESQFARLQLDVEVNTGTYTYLKERESEAEILLSSVVSDAEILDPPSEPWEPVSPSWPLNLLLGVLVGLFLGVVSAAIGSSLSRRVSSSDVVERLGVKFIGEIIFTKAEPSGAVEAQAQYGNAIYSLKALVELKGNKPHILGISSELSQDAKDFAFVFARFLASLGRRVLLIDADFSQKAVGVEKGLAQVLEAGGEIEVAKPSVESSNLWVLSRGSTTTDPSIFLEGDSLAKALTSYAKSYDWIVVSLQPIELRTEAVLTARAVGSVAIVIEKNRTLLDKLREMLRVSTVNKIKVVGVILAQRLTRG